jgi:hypothetical protein
VPSQSHYFRQLDESSNLPAAAPHTPAAAAGLPPLPGNDKHAAEPEAPPQPLTGAQTPSVWSRRDATSHERAEGAEAAAGSQPPEGARFRKALNAIRVARPTAPLQHAHEGPLWACDTASDEGTRLLRHIVLDSHGTLLEFAARGEPGEHALRVLRPDSCTLEPGSTSGEGAPPRGGAFVVAGTLIEEALTKEPLRLSLRFEAVVEPGDDGVWAAQTAAAAWVKSIQLRLGDDAAAEAAFRAGSLWNADEDASCCAACGSGFGLVLFGGRRHHCRGCGEIFCGSCSCYTADCSHNGYTKPQRVCAACAQIRHSVLRSQASTTALEERSTVSERRISSPPPTPAVVDQWDPHSRPVTLADNQLPAPVAAGAEGDWL